MSQCLYHKRMVKQPPDRFHDHQFELLNKHPIFRWAGVISFAVGAILGFVFQYKITLPLDLPSGLVAMVISFIVYIVFFKMTPDAAVDEKLVSGLKK